MDLLVGHFNKVSIQILKKKKIILKKKIKK